MAPPRHVLITGGSRGIGHAIAQLFAQSGYRCTLIAKSESRLRGIVSTLPKPSPSPSTSSEPSDSVEHAYIVADLSMPRFWTSKIFGEMYLSPHRENNYSSKIDVLVNCVGMSRSRLFIATDPAEIEHAIDTNLKSLVVGTRYFLRRGHIQGVSDLEGRKQSPVIINVELARTAWRIWSRCVCR